MSAGLKSVEDLLKRLDMSKSLFCDGCTVHEVNKKTANIRAFIKENDYAHANFHAAGLEKYLLGHSHEKLSLRNDMVDILRELRNKLAWPICLEVQRLNSIITASKMKP